MNTFPDLGKAMKLLKISVELEDVAAQDSIFGMAVNEGLRKQDLERTIEMIVSQYNDNPLLVSNMVGYNLMQEILQVYEPQK